MPVQVTIWPGGPGRRLGVGPSVLTVTVTLYGLRVGPPKNHICQWAFAVTVGVTSHRHDGCRVRVGPGGPQNRRRSCQCLGLVTVTVSRAEQAAAGQIEVQVSLA
jgi:hypothetical protein